MQDVAVFAKTLIEEEELNLHPDDDFLNYVNLGTGEATYSREEACLRNSLMHDAFNVCEASNIDIYSFMQEIFMKSSALDQFIPLPTS
jgi:hypothetical protein